MASQNLLSVLKTDDSLPIAQEARELWLRDMRNPLRMFVLPICRMICSLQLHTTYFLKRLFPIQFRAHNFLQGLICWFMKWWITPEANILILRHYTTESNIINFLIANSQGTDAKPLELYPKSISDMMQASLVDHDQELFRSMKELGAAQGQNWPIPSEQLDWSTWRPMEVVEDPAERKWTQFLDFETAHVLFMSLFCLLLTTEEYEAAINGFQFDHSIGIRIAKMLDDPYLAELAYNKFPHYVVSPWNLTQRFLMHGFFTEYMYAALEDIRQETHHTPVS